MSDDLLPYYQRELEFLRATSNDFAERYRKVAARLALKDGESKDPHVERLIQGVAYLNARIRAKLDDDFPEIARSMLEIVYPHLVRPVPSATLLQLELSPSHTARYDLPRGMHLESEPEQRTGSRAIFRTASPLTLWPLEVSAATFQHRPFAVPGEKGFEQALSMVTIGLRTSVSGVKLRLLGIEGLRFYLHAGRSTDVYRLQELLLTRCQGVLVSDPDDEEAEVHLLPKDAVQMVGFAEDEALLPQDARTFPGYRLLTEYFTFPEKFLFLDIQGLEQACAKAERQIKMHFLLDVEEDTLVRNVDEETFRLGCVPLINLYEDKVESFELTHEQTAYPIVPDPRHEDAVEVYSIEEVVASNIDGEDVIYWPFYSAKHAVESDSRKAFWHTERRLRERDRALADAPETELWMNFVNLDYRSMVKDEWAVTVRAQCHNGRLPARLPRGNDRPEFDFSEGRGPIAKVRCLVHPTEVVPPRSGYQDVWQAVSHLSLNHLSITDGAEGADALKEILLLYDRRGSSQQLIEEGVVSVTSQIVTRPLGARAGGFGRGTEISIEFDESQFTGSGIYQLANVLDHFFGLYASLNSFTELEVSTQQRKRRERPWRWPPRSGAQALV